MILPSTRTRLVGVKIQEYYRTHLQLSLQSPLSVHHQVFVVDLLM